MNNGNGYWLFVGEDEADADENGYVWIPSERELSGEYPDYMDQSAASWS